MYFFIFHHKTGNINDEYPHNVKRGLLYSWIRDVVVGGPQHICWPLVYWHLWKESTLESWADSLSRILRHRYTHHWRPLRKSVRKSMVHSRRASAWSSMVEEGWAAEGEGQNDWAEDRPPDRPDQGKMPLPILLPQNNGRLVYEWSGSFKTKILFLSFQMLLIQTATPDRSREENKQSVHEDTRSPLPPSPYPPFILPLPIIEHHPFILLPLLFIQIQQFIQSHSWVKISGGKVGRPVPTNFWKT